MPHISVKGQILADLVAEFTEPALEEMSITQNMDGKSVGMISLQEPPFWKVYVDGAANYRGSGVGLVLILLEKLTIEKSLRLGFLTKNNEAEYEALLEGVRMVQRMGGGFLKREEGEKGCLIYKKGEHLGFHLVFSIFIKNYL